MPECLPGGLLYELWRQGRVEDTCHVQQRDQHRRHVRGRHHVSKLDHSGWRHNTSGVMKYRGWSLSVLGSPHVLDTVSSC